MKQVLQDLKSGKTYLETVPTPSIADNMVLIDSKASLISAGTERMLLEFGRSSLVGKARSQPDKVRQVLDKMKTDGIMPTIEAVFRRLDEPLPLGYCNSGVVLEVGKNVKDIKVGDRVISNGPHAQQVLVPQNLCAKIPETVSFENASFTVLASIGLQGIRLLEPGFGDRIVVYGLGLIGLICVQLLKAHGCEVVGIDIDDQRIDKAKELGAIGLNGVDDKATLNAVNTWSKSKGVDGVLITASASNDDIVHQSANMCRTRGKIVLTGVTNLNLQRSDFYDKELSFQVSCSYGPGRYDDYYESGISDYPFGFVRWTEQRNFEAILKALENQSLQVNDLISHRFEFEKAEQAYNTLAENKQSLGIILEYPGENEAKKIVSFRDTKKTKDKPAVAVIGAGNFSKMTLLPALVKSNASINIVCSLQGRSATYLAKKFNAQKATSNYQVILDDDSINTVFIAVQHDLHASMTIDALNKNKHVFVEKPLALNIKELKDIVSAYEQASNKQLMVGFNRRFSPHIVHAKKQLSMRSGPISISVLVNAGDISANHWVHDLKRGGGRIIGEGCHFIDLCSFLCGSPVISVYAAMLGEGPEIREDKMSITLTFKDGSVGTVQYLANGSKAFPKERVEIFFDGNILQIDNFRKTNGYGVKSYRTSKQDKGHQAEVKAFLNVVENKTQALIPFNELINVTLASFAAVTSANEGRAIVLSTEYHEVLDQL